MSVAEIKQKIHSFIDMIDDEQELDIIAETVEVYANHLNKNSEELSPEQSERLEEALEQVKNKILTPHSEVMKREKKWPSK